MREIVYYYEYFKEHREGFKVYESNKFQYNLHRTCDRVWRQGKFGGVKILNENWMSDAYSDASGTRNKQFYGHKYLTKNEDAMREFAWVKLSAQQYTKEK